MKELRGQTHLRHSMLHALTSGPTAANPGELIGSLASEADRVLINSPRGLAVGDTTALVDKVHGLLFLIEPDVVSRHQLANAREQQDKVPRTLLVVIIARRTAGSSNQALRMCCREDDGDRRRPIAIEELSPNCLTLGRRPAGAMSAVCGRSCANLAIARNAV